MFETSNLVGSIGTVVSLTVYGDTYSYHVMHPDRQPDRQANQPHVADTRKVGALTLRR